MCAAQRYKRSVILWSPEKRLPGALGVGERRAAEFQNLKHFLYSSSILAKNAGSPQERARSARAKASATVMGPVQTVSLPVRR